MMFIATYSDPRSRTGQGTAIVGTPEQVARIAATYSNVEFRIYRPENETILTPSVVTACMGSSASL